MTKHAYTINESAHEIGVGRSKLYELIAEGKIQTRKIGKRTIILADDLRNFLANLPAA